MAPASLHSARLSFGRDGRTLIAVARDAVTIVGMDGGPVVRLAIAGVSAAVGFADQVWTVRGGDPTLERWTLAGTPISESVSLGPGPGDLIAAAAGPPAAVWTGVTPRAWVEEGDRLVGLAIPPDRLAIALTGRRWITVRGSRISVPSGLSCELPASTRLGAGAITLDGTAVAVVAERAGARELVAITLANGRPQHRIALPGTEARIATRTGTTVVQVAPRELVVIDLHRGWVTAQHTTDYDITDFAVDPDGEQLALRGALEHVELVSVRELAAKASIVREPDDETVSPPPAMEPAERVAPSRPIVVEERVAAEPIRFDVRALAPRASVEMVERAIALSLLDSEMRIVALRTLRAIATAWNTRRLGYGNEGLHPYEHEVAALLGMNDGFARDYVAAADDHLADALAAVPVEERRAPTTPLGALAAELELSPLAADILLAVAAPALWSEAARLYGILANDPARSLVDEALLEQILGGVSRHDLAAELDPRAPLVRLGIVEIDTRRPRPFAGLTVDPVILARLRREQPGLGLGLSVRGSDRAIQELAVAPGVLERAAAGLAMMADHRRPVRIVLRGRPGTGRRTLLAALAAEAHRALGIIDTSVLPRTEYEFATTVRGALRRAQLAGLVPCLVGLEAIAFDDRSGRDAIHEVVRAHPGPVAVVLPTDEAPPFDAEHVAIDLPVLGETERIGVWKRALADAAVTVSDVDALAARYRIGPGMVHRAVAAARTESRQATDATAAIDAFIRKARDARLGAYARRVAHLASWDQVVLAPDILDSLRELVSRVRHRRTVFETWGMERTMATSRGLTALFSGPPGTGKTLVAGVIARELGLDVYQVDLSKVMSKWIGETERNLGAIFDAAEDGQVILLFDEADSLFAKRTEIRSSNDRYANLEVNYLLQRLDAFEGIAILTTNSRGSIDPAFKRRLSFRLSFPFPDEETREQLWRAHLPPGLPVAGSLDLDRLAHKYQLSGGYIRNACLRAAFLAAQEATHVSQHHLERAVALEFAELGKLSNGGSLD